MFQAILRSFAPPEVTPRPGARLVDISTLLKRYPNRPIVVFPECTTTNGRGVLPLSRSLVAVPPQTKIYPVSVRYTPADVTTPIPGSYFTFLWNLLSKPTHCIRVRIAECVTNSKSTSTSTSATNHSDTIDGATSSSTDTLLGDDTNSDLTREDKAVLDYVGEALARLGRIKRVGLGVQEKQEFVKMWTKSIRRR